MKGFDSILELYPSNSMVSWKYVDKLRKIQVPSTKEMTIPLRGRMALITVGTSKFAVFTRNREPYLQWKEEHETEPNFSDNIFDMWFRIKEAVR